MNFIRSSSIFSFLSVAFFSPYNNIIVCSSWRFSSIYSYFSYTFVSSADSSRSYNFLTCCLFSYLLDIDR